MIKTIIPNSETGKTPIRKRNKKSKVIRKKKINKETEPDLDQSFEK